MSIDVKFTSKLIKVGNSYAFYVKKPIAEMLSKDETYKITVEKTKEVQE